MQRRVGEAEGGGATGEGGGVEEGAGYREKGGGGGWRE